MNAAYQQTMVTLATPMPNARIRWATVNVTAILVTREKVLAKETMTGALRRTDEDKCFKGTVKEGEMLYIPAGWIVRELTPAVSITYRLTGSCFHDNWGADEAEVLFSEQALANMSLLQTYMGSKDALLLSPQAYARVVERLRTLKPAPTDGS